MANQNGRIFIDTSTTPNKGVEIADLQRVLGRGTGDLGLLCADQEWYLLPYQRVEYLESTGTQYIDTGIKGNTAYKYILDYKSNAILSVPIFGMRNQSTYNQGPIFSFTYAGNGMIFYVRNYSDSDSSKNSFPQKNNTERHRVVINISKSELTMDGVSASFITPPNQAFVTDYNLFVFANNVAGANSTPAPVRFYEYLVMDGDTEIQHFIPVRVGNVGYMYDLVSGELFGNSGSGAFELGQDVDSHILRAVNRINPLAFWKPFRSSEKGFATTADQKAAIIAARCGFGIDQGGSLVYPTYTPNNGTSIPHAVWEYKKPRGKGGGDNGADEWYRINDFAPLGGTVGYYSHAVSPIYADFPASITSGSTVTPKTTITIRIDGSGDTERWRQNLCIAFADLFPSNSVYENYRFAVVFKNSRGTIVAVSPQSMANIRTNYYATVNVAYEDLETLIPTVGNTVEAAVCLIQNTNYSTTDTTILTNYTGTVVSLEISSGCDRTTLSYTGAGSIVGMSGTVTLTMGSKQTNTSIVGLSGYYPIEQIDVTLTAGPNWQNLTGVNLVLVLQCDGAMGTSSYPGGTQYLRFSLALTAGQTNRQYTAVYKRGVNGFDSAAWVPSSADAHLMIQFYAEQGDTTQALSAPQSPILLPR